MEVFDEYLAIQKFLVALAAGYLLGSIPFASLAARYRGVDIFSTGSRTAGAANVFWNIGRGTGLAVLLGDIAKGSVAVLIAGLLDLSWLLTLFVAGAAVLGHWNSIFSRFKGGDGMAALMGISLTLEPVLTTLGIAAGAAGVLFSRRSPQRAGWALSTCFLAMLGASQYYGIDRPLVLGLAAIAMLVLGHAMLRRRCRPSVETSGKLLNEPGPS